MQYIAMNEYIYIYTHVYWYISTYICSKFHTIHTYSDSLRNSPCHSRTGMEPNFNLYAYNMPSFTDTVCRQSTPARTSDATLCSVAPFVCMWIGSSAGFPVERCMHGSYIDHEALSPFPQQRRCPHDMCLMLHTLLAFPNRYSWLRRASTHVLDRLSSNALTRTEEKKALKKRKLVLSRLGLHPWRVGGAIDAKLESTTELGLAKLFTVRRRTPRILLAVSIENNTSGRT